MAKKTMERSPFDSGIVFLWAGNPKDAVKRVTTVFPDKTVLIAKHTGLTMPGSIEGPTRRRYLVKEKVSKRKK